MHQDCRTCPLYPVSLGGMFAEAVQRGVAELSGVGAAWDDPLMRRGCEVRIYYGDREVSATGDTAEIAMRKALAAIQSA